MTDALKFILSDHQTTCNSGFAVSFKTIVLECCLLAATNFLQYLFNSISPFSQFFNAPFFINKLNNSFLTIFLFM